MYKAKVFIYYREEQFEGERFSIPVYYFREFDSVSEIFELYDAESVVEIWEMD